MKERVHPRPLVEADLPAIRRWMLDSPHAPAWGDGVLSHLAKPSSEEYEYTPTLRRAWIADDEQGNAAGFAVAAATPIAGESAECELEFVLVAPGARRMGIGSALLQSVILWAREIGASEIWLEVRASNQQAIALYTSSRFVPMWRRPGYYANPPEDAVLMRLRIDRLQENAPV